jgi:uncharacterized protein (DUF2267 family)
MRYNELVRYVERVGAEDLGHEGAERAIAATLTTLARCLPVDVAHDLADQLPVAAKAGLITTGPQPQLLSLSAFLERVAELEGISSSEALDHVRAVMDAIREAVTGHELRNVQARLPDEYETLFALPAAARWPETHRHHPHP